MKLNLPTQITLIRIFLIPVMLLFAMPAPFWIPDGAAQFLSTRGFTVAFIIFFIASVTDLLDGYLARKMNIVTNMGVFLDPIADKLLVVSALIAILSRGYRYGWIVVAIIAREFIVSGLRLIAAGKGTIVSADRFGKAKTVLQMVAISAVFLNNYPLSLVSSIDFGRYLMGLAALLTLYSGANYIRVNRRLLREG